MKHLYFCSCEKTGGIYHYTLENGGFVFKEKYDLDRPTYMIIEGKKVYITLRETDAETHFGGVITAELDENGRLVNWSKPQSSLGVVPCHVCVKNGEIYTANYLSGNIAKLPETIVTHEGHGVNPTRQEAPHTHFVTVAPDGYILCCDLGLDTIFTYDAELNFISKSRVPDGMGCRHLQFSNDGKTVWCVNEMGNTVSVFDYSDGVLTLRNTVDALPDFSEQNTAAAIRLNGKYLYVSHRGADTVARFEVADNGDIKLLENTPIGGVSPRDIWIIDELLLSANEITDSVTVLKLKDGKPVSFETALPMQHPLCICAVEFKEEA